MKRAVVPARAMALATGVLFSIALAPAQAGSGTPAFTDYAAPSTLSNASNAGEPSIGVDWATGSVMYQAYSSTYAVTFDDTKVPATAAWSDVSSGVLVNLDPILFTDASSSRTFAGGEAGNCGNLYDSDNDGRNWQQMGNACAGSDHETIGSGPWHGSAPLLASYNHAVYYCAQQTVTDVCAVSSDGGTTFGTPVTVGGACSSLHGHVKVSADGTAYLPNSHCGGNPGGGITSNNGSSWNSYTIPASVTGNGFDPSVATTPDNTVYEAWADANNHPMVALSTDHGGSWSKITDLSGTFSPAIVNSTFQAAIGGDNGRVAIAYLGSTTAGNPFSNTWHGVWDLYVSFTYDGGATWTTVKATTTPVQRGWICSGGTTCNSGRNLLDFIDASVAKDGRVVVAYANGCVDSCATASGTESQSTSAWATIARQQSGKGLFAAYDTGPATVPGAPTLSATAGNGQVSLSWTTPANGGSAITGYKVNRGTTSGAETPLTTVGVVNAYTDSGLSNGTTYYYTVAAVNSVGSGGASAEASATPAANPPVASFTSSCNGLSCSFDGSASSGSITSYGWNFGDGSSGSGKTVSHTYGAAGSYSVTLTVTDNSNQTGTNTQSVTVTASAGSPCSTCVKESGSFSSGLFGNSDNYHPQAIGSSGFSSNGGNFEAHLRGAAGTNFYLYLEVGTAGLFGTSWSAVASSTGAGTGQDVLYSGGAGTYRWHVNANGGSGSYDIYYLNP